LTSRRPAEQALLAPVLRLFPKRKYRRTAQVEYCRKRIDLLCVPRRGLAGAVAVELKVSDWQRAMWQAYQNLQVASHSYIAIWHRFARRPASELDSLALHGLGLITVGPRGARIVLRARDTTYRLARAAKSEFYSGLAGSL
jgi:hypothetical protein